ncbi:MAG: methyltransferase domain-containing protein, partial [Nocardioidaceae bacterium]
GPHPLWQLEDLLPELGLTAGQHVLDLGPGLGAASVFLARECGVTVDAFDSWVSAEEMSATFEECGVADRVTPVHGDIRTAELPPERYDAIVSVDAWEYFGTDTYFLRHLLPALKAGGHLGFSTPALREDPYAVEVLPLMKKLVGRDVASWHPAEWWRWHTELTGGMVNVKARVPADSLELWLRWEEATKDGDDEFIEMLRTLLDDEGDEPALGIVLVTASKA